MAIPWRIGAGIKGGDMRTDFQGVAEGPTGTIKAAGTLPVLVLGPGSAEA
jgi:hypothetical protein